LFFVRPVTVPLVGNRKHTTQLPMNGDYTLVLSSEERSVPAVLLDSPSMLKQLARPCTRNQGSTADIKDKYLLQRMTQKLEDERDAHTCYIKILEAQIG
jgi:hypothetical protein